MSQFEGLSVMKSIVPVIHAEVFVGLVVSPLAYKITSLLSSVYIFHASANCRWLFMHEMPCPFCLALARAGKSIAARMAMMAMTTSSSISVKPPHCWWSEKYPRAEFDLDDHINFLLSRKLI